MIRRPEYFTERSERLAELLVCAFVVALVAAGATPVTGTATHGATQVTAQDPTDITVHDVSVSGKAVAVRDDTTVYLWQSQPYTLNVTIGGAASDSRFRICARTDAVDQALNCKVAAIRPSGTAIKLPVPGSNTPGVQNLTVTMDRVGEDETVVASQLTRLHVIQPSGDVDGDGLSNRAEKKAGTNLTIPDTDTDALNDGAEVNTYNTSPLLADTDGDGLHDQEEVAGKTNATNGDTDGDGISDGKEVALGLDPTVATTDADGDGLTDEREIRLGTDPTDPDTDGDLLSDGTEVALGTDPTNPKTGIVLAGMALVAVAVVVGLFYRFWSQLVAGAWSIQNTARSKLTRSDETPVSGSSVERRTVPTPGDAPTTDGGGTDSDSSEPLSDQDRVVKLLEDNDGRLRQSEIVSQTPWSKSKVSRLLARMDDQGQVVKINAGRQNIIVLPGEEPTELRSPHDRDPKEL